MNFNLIYDGKTLNWEGFGSWKASSGMLGHQSAAEQCSTDEGPMPEGTYKILLNFSGEAKDDGTNRCNLAPAWGFQTIPRGQKAGECEFFWANWGYNRIRLEPADTATKHACSAQGHNRGGFYLHDSAKGYTHGCIETENAFFWTLRALISKMNAGSGKLKVKYLTLTIKYKGDSTYGGTKVSD